MTMLRILVLVARGAVILTIAVAGAAVVDSVLAQSWRGVVVSISLPN
jgi:hypothetical protein